MDISGILNLIQGSRLVKTGADIKPLAEPQDAFYLKVGDVVEGRIVRTLPNNQVVFSSRGREITARTNLPLKPGDQIQVEVQRTKGEVLLKVLSRRPSVEGMIRQELKPLLGTLHKPISKVILDVEAAIQSILSSETPLQDKELTTLLNKLSSLLKALNVAPESQEEIPAQKGLFQQPMDTILAKGLEEDLSGSSLTEESPPALMKWIRDSGLEWENKVWQLFENPQENLSESIRALIQHDLKGLTQKIIDLLPTVEELGEKPVESEPAPPPSAPATARPEVPDGQAIGPRQEAQAAIPPSASHFSGSEALTQLATHLEHLSQTIQVHQWMNALQHDAQQQFYFQIPLALSDGLKPLDLFIYKKKREREAEEARKELDQQDFWVVFFLTLSTLGSLRIDLKTRQKNLTVRILTGTEVAARHIAPFLPQLESALGAIGFQVKGAKVEKAPDGKVAPPDPVRAHPSITKGMVSIVA